jgi:hypothetical protein
VPAAAKQWLRSGVLSSDGLLEDTCIACADFGNCWIFSVQLLSQQISGRNLNSVQLGFLAYTLIGGTAVGTVLTLVFLAALYTIWFRVKPRVREQAPEGQPAH